MIPAPKKKANEKKKKPAAKAKAPAGKKAPASKKPAEKKIQKPVSAPVVMVKADTKDAKKDTAAPKGTAVGAKMKGIRIRLSAFDYTVLDEAAMKIIDTAVRTGAVVRGPTPLPTKLRKFTVNRSTFVHKDARDQFEMRIHRRLIDLSETTFKTVDALQNLSLASGVDIEIKMG